jgi:hypothetical protein
MAPGTLKLLGRCFRLTAIATRIRLILFAVLLSVPLIPRPADAELPRTERGTLIVAVRWRLGIVVCADRRRLMEEVGKVRYRDDALKIVAAPPFGLAAIYGTTVYGREGVRPFDVRESVERYAGELAGGSVVRNAQQLAAQLEAEMAEVLEQDNLPLPQPKPGDPGVFAIILFALERGTLSETLLLGVSSETDFKVQVIPRPSNQVITVLGHSSVALAIRGFDPRFQDLRTDPLLGRMLINPRQEALVPYLSKHDAMSFGRSLIRVTSERLPLLQETEDVSPESDCAGLTWPDGFEWLPVVP